MGIDGTAVDDTQTALLNECFRNLVTRKYTSNSLITFQFYLDTDEAIGYTLQEVGMLAGAHVMTAPLGGIMVARAVMAPFYKSGDVGLTPPTLLSAVKPQYTAPAMREDPGVGFSRVRRASR